MKTPLSLLSLLALTAVSCQSAAGPEFEAGLSRVSLGGGYNQSTFSDGLAADVIITQIDLDLSAGLFLCDDIEAGGILHFKSDTEDVVGSTTADLELTDFQAKAYGRWYFDQSEGTRHWIHGEIGLESLEPNGVSAETAVCFGIGVGHTHFLTDSSALEVGAFFQTANFGDFDPALDKTTVNIIGAYSIFW